MYRVHKIKLNPTAEQSIYFARSCGVARFSYNWALAEWKKEYDSGGKPNEAMLRKRLNSIKAEEYPWMLEVTKVAPQQAIKNLGTAYKNFFEKLKKNPKNAGFPKFKKKGLRDSFRADDGPKSSTSSTVECKDKTVKLPKCGVVRMRENLRFDGRTISCTISKQADGWYAAILVDTSDCLAGRLGRATVGVDLGIKVLATLSTGEVIPALKPHRAANKRLVKLSRNLSSKKNGSSNKAKARTKLAKLHLRIKNVRADALHQLTTKLATEFETVVIEDLNVKGMMRNHKLARSIADAGFGEFRRQLEYKATMTGAKLLIADRFFPSSKTCSSCGEIHPMKLSSRVMTCGCGNVMDRDLNASINLKNLANK